VKQQLLVVCVCVRARRACVCVCVCARVNIFDTQLLFQSYSLVMKISRTNGVPAKEFVWALKADVQSTNEIVKLFRCSLCKQAYRMMLLRMSLRAYASKVRLNLFTQPLILNTALSPGPEPPLPTFTEKGMRYLGTNNGQRRSKPLKVSM
jgi:hypothetical protein